jgi:hypothetical protein
MFVHEINDRTCGFHQTRKAPGPMVSLHGVVFLLHDRANFLEELNPGAPRPQRIAFDVFLCQQLGVDTDVLRHQVGTKRIVPLRNRCCRQPGMSVGLGRLDMGAQR